MIGKVNSFHSFSTNDGPGIRAVIFLQGCPLRCKCCHNPETWSTSDGIEMSVEEVIQKIKKGSTYYKKGGVTCSGGEPLMQAEFVEEIFKACHELSLHTTLDTSGCLLNDDVKKVLDQTDLVLLDFKMTTEEEYNAFAKGSLIQTVKFLDYLNSISKPTWIRHVVIPGINDTLKQTQELKEILKPYECIERVDFLPYKSLCISKYDELQIEFPYKDIKEATNEDIEKIEAWFNE
ncbi:pyruvate formate-lyase-activating protein [Anaerorhabdus sp.]|uniref:pyruvate formate-lyase-activating protein n=1 Tax=Anaerorhabdus sp. TaxID=1872524 RepID=UPI002B20697D|nr:pyruvate formate-lyase-activating protein [Anaerorhabdus sp.]MEA4875892.1 pyruvate formate-lyase-activating protein [Anaerorhabdus sp.]